MDYSSVCRRDILWYPANIKMTAGSIVAPQIIPLRVPIPGRAKSQIDSNTPIEIKSDTPDVTIYYTLDGTKPEATKRPGYGENSTVKYQNPITLPDGKVVVKALAVTSDGRESAVVTKCFLVEYVEPEPLSLEDDEENFLKDYAKQIQDYQENLDASGRQRKMNRGIEMAWNETARKYQALKVTASSTPKTPKGPRFLNSRLGTPSQSQDITSVLHTQRSQTATSGDASRKLLTSTQILRIQRETDFLRCAHCLAPRPTDPFARFCQECGSPMPPVPGQRLPPPEGAQLGLCIECKTMVPVNTPTCIVCEAPIPPQLQPQASIRLKDKIICSSCGTGNPNNLQFCVICEKKLDESQSHPVFCGESAPPVPSSDNKMVSCSKCGRINSGSARFCDWCGSRAAPPVSYMTCSKCGANAHPYAHYCSSCGVYLEAPPRVNTQNGMTFSSALAQTETLEQQDSTGNWQPLTIQLPDPKGGQTKKVSQQTQTVGLFYPSCKTLEKREDEVVQQKEKLEQMSDRKPLLTAISPGRGYWRKQVDHICAHFRCYAQNNTEFRALIGEPRLGKMISATVHEDNYELSLRINFVLAGNKGFLGGKPAKLSENNFLSSVTEGRNGLYSSQSSLVSENSETASTRKKKKAKKTRKILEREDKLPPEDRQLLKEVGPDGKGRISVVEELLDEGADPNCMNNDNRPVLTVAVLGQHHEVIPVLIQKGADIDQQSGLVSNTALHEAAALGNQGLECTETLLGCNASIKKKNDKGLTAYDLAVKTGSDKLISLFASQMGQGMLNRLSKNQK
ncbi:double zinc ribbon and ankyrin repeat-containing protein 1 isoform X1 [Polypterus senegalus]|uniref:double zinc ribbon and ankyrin repeat-containing protein 1 isoform X1 n=2 Tax=Polypterus senegalus TaxID=55291 RepID=UPI001962F66B|nr:double zinc ribbon and ankyrin repeat-containing protein 1 isoform X1 [Polypterus senegalus]